MPSPSPSRLSRRSFLTGTAATAVAAGAAGVLAGCSRDAGGTTTSGDAGPAATAPARWVEFAGAHQAGIVDPVQANAVVAAFDLTAPDRPALASMFQALSAETASLMAGQVAPPRDRLYPPTDNLVLGPEPGPDDLTITWAVGASLFDDRYGLAGQRPAQLVAMPKFPNDALEPGRTHGDLLAQVCAQRPETCVHALRRLMRASRASVTLRWMMNGFVEPNTLGPGRASGRNLLGFKDGTANPDASDRAVARELVWVTEADGEPAWAAGGTYMVVRLIRNRVEFWDRTPLRTQETIMGRYKDTGAPLDGRFETDVPGFDADPKGDAIPLNAHIRLANPRTPGSEKNLILRRGFNYSAGFTTDGQLDQGLLFVCFQRSLQHGFLTVQNRLNGESLEEYIKPVGGGFFYALPGATTGGWLGQGLLT